MIIFFVKGEKLSNTNVKKFSLLNPELTMISFVFVKFKSVFLETLRPDYNLTCRIKTLLKYLPV